MWIPYHPVQKKQHTEYNLEGKDMKIGGNDTVLVLLTLILQLLHHQRHQLP
jgi:hypothetical protein